jgi:diadenosine tetraphosphatase ApaH/serine/threonine PP2A family protein phosphatase
VIALISDIHSNFEALEAVLDVLEARGVRNLACLGDIVGYGPQPSECIAALRSWSQAICIQGNHDAALLGTLDSTGFNENAKKAIDINRTQLGADDRRFLKALPLTAEAEGVLLFHGSPTHPLEEYLKSPTAIHTAFRVVEGRWIAVGHTHDPLLIFMDSEGKLGARQPEGDQIYPLAPDRRYLMNVGSVGQPRDGDPRACATILDPESGTMEYIRVPYDVAATQKKMRALGFPEYLGSRLGKGQ